MNNQVKQILEHPTCSVEEYRVLVPGSKNSAYEAIKRGEIETIRVGKRIHVLTAPLRAKLGLDRLSSPLPNTSAAHLAKERDAEIGKAA